jgi:hypothetical protein
LRALAKLSRPRLKLNAAGLTAEQTALGNRLARELRNLDPVTVAAMHRMLDEVLPAKPEPRRPGAGRRGGRAKAGPKS